jgi:RNA polymerase sigma-70 factor (ECF subfamily)
MESDGSKNGWCERLYRERGTALLLYGRALGLSHSEAEDVLQEVFIQLLGHEEAPKQPEFYCLRAFRNRALNYRRSLWRRLAREWESRRWFEPETEVDPREEAAKCRLAQLPPDQREVIVLKIWHDYTFDEIADLLAISPNTVAGRYRYGLQKLRVALAANPMDTHELNGESITFLATSTSVGPR